MYLVHETHRADIIKKVWSDPALWESMKDDYMLAPDEFEPVIDDHNKWFLARKDNKVLGVIRAHRLNHIMWQVHVGFSIKYWGTEHTKAVGSLILPAVFEATGAEKLYANIPVDREPVIMYALDNGMEIEGTCKKSWSYDGVLLDTYHLGASK